MNPEPFDTLYKRFRSGLTWINQGYLKRGWIYGNRTIDSKFESDIKEFETKVVAPMELEWQKLTESEKEKYEPAKI